MNQHRPWALVALAALVALIVAAVAVASPTGNKKKPTVASLQKQVASLKAQNTHLNQYTPKAIAKQLAAVKAALDKYQSVDVAKADGYVPSSPCVMEPADPNASSYGGVMGVHFMNPALLKPGPLNPMKPPILTYEPESNGSYTLLAAEYFQPDADQNLATDNDRPTLFGRAFDGPMKGHDPHMPIHYDLHVSLWKHNPSGIFSPFNPAAHC